MARESFWSEWLNDPKYCGGLTKHKDYSNKLLFEWCRLDQNLTGGNNCLDRHRQASDQQNAMTVLD